MLSLVRRIEMFFATDTYFFAKLLIILFCGAVMSGMPGGLTEQRVADKEIQKICNDVSYLIFY